MSRKLTKEGAINIDWSEGISQIVKCVDVETPYCENVELNI